MLNPIRLVSTILGLAVIATPIAAVAFFFVTITGNPGTCGEDAGRDVTSSLQLAASFHDKWDTLEATLSDGQPAAATFTDSEVTSSASLWLATQDAPIHDVMICFRDGSASVSAKIDIPFVPGDVDVLARGTLILTGGIAEADIQELEAGGLPSPLTDLVKNVINDVAEEQTEKLTIEHSYELRFTEGAVIVNGVP